MTLYNTPPRIPFRITDDRNEMENLGRQIVEANPDVYTDRVIGIVKRYIDNMMPNASAEEKEGVYYRSIYDYWAYGNSIAQEFYYDFFNKSCEEKSSYIVAQTLKLYCAHLNDKVATDKLINDKYGTYKFLRQYYFRDMILIHDEGSYYEFHSFISKHPVFVVKPLNFGIGLYVYKDSVDNYASPRELFDKLLQERIRMANDTSRNNILQVSGEVDVVLEEVINQAPEMAALHPESVNSLRINTFKDGNDVKIFYPFLKVGVGNSMVDNAAAGGLFAGINLSTGVVETDLFDEGRHCNNPLKCHPDTGVKVRGFQIPRWDEAVDLAKECSRKLDGINYVGWDFALTPRGWCIVEGNTNPAAAFYQIAYGRGMRKEFEEFIGWKLEKQFWWQ